MDKTDTSGIEANNALKNELRLAISDMAIINAVLITILTM